MKLESLPNNVREPETLTLLRELILERFGHLEGLVIHVPADEKEAPSIAALQGVDDARVSYEALRDFCFHPILRRFLHEQFSDLPNHRPEHTWLRLKGPKSSATPPHIDLNHFRERLALERGLPPQTPLCCFCGCQTSSLEVPACQRCGGGGLETAWVPLTSGLDPAEASMLEISGVQIPFVAGDRVRFDGAEPHRAKMPTNRGAPLRISIDSRCVHNNFLPGFAWPSACPEREVEWLAVANDLVTNSPNLTRGEGFNTRWLLEMFGEVGQQITRESRALSQFKSMRQVGCRHATGTRTEPPGNWKRIGDIFYAWVMANHDNEARSILLKAISLFPSWPRTFVISAKTGLVHKRHVVQVLHATHLVFMATDWLISPHRWNPNISGARSVLEYCCDAYDAIVEAGVQQQNAEIYLELAGVVGMLARATSEEAEQVLGPARAMAMKEETFWHEAARLQRKSKRTSAEIHLHCFILRAWTCRLFHDTTHHQTREGRLQGPPDHAAPQHLALDPDHDQAMAFGTGAVL